MSKLISARIDVTKIPKEAIYIGEKGKYLTLDIWINDDDDKYGNNCSVNIQQSKEDREAKTPKTYIGNGQTKFGFGDKPAPAPSQQPGVVTAKAGDWDDADDDIPF
jgi:hypothetical protein